ncbi:P-loop containing nucleoside triphosphate hydrolase protein [Aspergillus alliaceus]|uniref:P-loop containing nucleoside triphosphate hydrolase protein n=1 Tax=Petromyces alliaceus TaxID=209559 RepID=A0A5N7CEN2_PETAA|nr:P-loop containing nucleoside triphosphate hydrolase protein [Aspergillus alliaceus]
MPAQQRGTPEHEATWISRLLFHWVSGLLFTGFKRPLQTHDIPPVHSDRSTHTLMPVVQHAFASRRQRGETSPLFWALYDTFKRDFWIGGACRVVADVLLVITPYTLRYLIQFAIDSYIADHLDEPGPPISQGIGLLIGIVAMLILQSLAHNTYMWRLGLVGGRIRAVLITSIFEKSVRVLGRARKSAIRQEDAHGQPYEQDRKQSRENNNQDFSTGYITQLLTVDSARIDKVASAVHIVWTSPLALLIAVALLIVNLRESALAGLALLIAGFVVLITGVGLLFHQREAIDRFTQKRIGLTHEVLGAIRLIKCFGWESGFARLITDVRCGESRRLQGFLAVRTAVGALSQALPVLTAMIAFITYALKNTELSPAIVFSSVALFTSLRMPLVYLPICIQGCFDSWAALRRIQRYLLAEEMEKPTLQLDLPAAAEIREGIFVWDGEDRSEETGTRESGANKDDKLVVVPLPVSEKMLSRFRLRDVSLTVHRGELLGVVGAVGSGKTSLLAALAGDMARVSGSLVWGATPVVCPQQPWIHNTTVRDNITFGRPFDEARYQQVVNACQLGRDLARLPHGDSTVVGERGVVLSGGQKQRLSLARAIYSGAELVLLEDPLSAVDATVGRAMRDEALCGLMSDSARVLCTHSIAMARCCDRVVWLDQGRVRAVGTFEQLLAQEPEFTRLFHGSGHSDDEDDDAAEEDEEEVDEMKIEGHPHTKNPVAASGGSEINNRLMQDEDQATRSVSWSVYGSLIGRTHNAILLVPLSLGLLALAQGSTVLAMQWLAWWSSNRFHLPRNTYIAIYVALAAGQVVFLYVFGLMVSICCSRSSCRMANQAVQRVLRAPIVFFDTTPLGRHMNRFTADIEAMDYALPESLRMFLLSLGGLLAMFALIISYFHWFAIGVGALIVLLVFLALYYRASAREIKRHESVRRSSVMARFDEGLMGASTLRTYGMEKVFSEALRDVVNDMVSASWTSIAMQRWLSLRQDAGTVLLVVVMGILVLVERRSRNPAETGLSLSMMLNSVQIIQVVVREWADVESAMNSTERLHTYAHMLPQEKDPKEREGLQTSIANQSDDTIDVNSEQKETNVTISDPNLNRSLSEKVQKAAVGEIHFTNVSMRYRDGLPDALRDINLHIQAGEHVAIVGRTGAGKSSIVNALFRLTPALSAGTISIDGMDISQLGLSELRGDSRNSSNNVQESILSIIPQDATLFEGTIRSNLDPFDAVADDAPLWEALRMAGGLDKTLHLSDFVQEGGGNLSLGQRQLLALARVLVRDSRILVCDEATAALDAAMDERIQRAVQAAFGHKTVLYIAHRLRSVLGYDRVCVMEAGAVAEIGLPLDLFRQGGIFRQMCGRLGITESQVDRARRRRGLDVTSWSSSTLYL